MSTDQKFHYHEDWKAISEERGYHDHALCAECVEELRRLREAEAKLELERAEHKVTEGLLAAEQEAHERSKQDYEMAMQSTEEHCHLECEELLQSISNLEAENKRLSEAIIIDLKELEMLEKTRQL